jgi:putative PEP-CTERM system histidine kinase
VQELIAFWSYMAAACAFGSVVLWRVRRRPDRSEKLLLAACFATAVWSVVAGVGGPTDPLSMLFGTLRNLIWVMLLYDISGGPRGQALSGVRLVFAAVALSIGLHLVLSAVALAFPLSFSEFGDVLNSASLLRITTSAGALVLVHNVYGQADPQSRLRIRGPMLGLTLMWGYDLNLSTLAYLQGVAAAPVDALFALRGVVMCLIAPLFAISAGSTASMKIKLSRAATFQSLSLVAIASYLALMALLAAALRHTSWNWGSIGTAGLLVASTALAAGLTLSPWARAWMKVKLAKHLFEHRYDYRTEWLRFTETLGRAGIDGLPLAERIVKAFADVLDAPGGLLLVTDLGRPPELAATWNWASANPPTDEVDASATFWSELESTGHILEFETLRHGWAGADEKALAVPKWMIEDSSVWVGIPLLHHQRLVGLVLLAAPEYRRPLDWEDFDLLRTAGNQAASSLAEAMSQEALANAQRFEEFNRRFAFILHDIKNLVSQLSLVARNAERHADNPDFRADMVATLKASVGKMNELLARLAPHSAARVQRIEAQPLRPILTAAIAAKRRDRDVQLLGDTSLCAMVDSSALEQAVGHLLQNAIDASSAAPVSVRVSAARDSVTIAIADKGIGMDGDFVRNRLFQPFASTKSGGFGIGAFEARALVTAMGGRLSVDSRPGQGTTFTITLAAAEPQSEPQRKRA